MHSERMRVQSECVCWWRRFVVFVVVVVGWSGLRCMYECVSCCGTVGKGFCGRRGIVNRLRQHYTRLYTNIEKYTYYIDVLYLSAAFTVGICLF